MFRRISRTLVLISRDSVIFIKVEFKYVVCETVFRNQDSD